MIKIVAVIPTLGDDPAVTIRSLIAQTVPIERILVAVGSKNLYNSLMSRSRCLPSKVKFVYVKPSSAVCIGKRIAKALNVVLGLVDLGSFDYLLRVDADVVLPEFFVEENLKLNADVVGSAGYALLVKVKPFLRILRGRFKEVCAEDSYLSYSFLYNGYAVESWRVKPKLLRKSGKPHSWKYFYIRGIEMYKIGYEPLHVIASLRYELRNAFAVLGYISSLLSRSQKYPFARCVFKKQLEKVTKVFG